VATTECAGRHADASDLDGGVALVAVLLLTVLLLVLGTAVVLMADVETTVAANHRDGRVTAHTAEGAIAFAIQELALLDDWTPVLAGGVSSRLAGGFQLPPTVGAPPLEVPAMTTALQQATYGDDAFGTDTPSWRLFGHGVLGTDLPFGGLSAQVFLLTWVSDDVGETDGDPLVDDNGMVVVRARAIGPRRSQCDIQAVIARVAPGVIRRVSWRLIR
jgi:hypothetical protein